MFYYARTRNNESMCYSPNMPPRAIWHARIPAILRQLETTDAPVLDRQSVQKLFGVRERTANVLVRTFGGYRAGNTFVLDRLQLIEALRNLSDPAAAAEQSRRARVVELVESLRSAPRPRIPSPPPPAPAELPEGITVPADGQMMIQFSRPEELLSRVLSLTQLASKDFAGFVARLEAARSVCTDRDASMEP